MNFNFPMEISGFSLYTNKKNKICAGKVYTKKIILNVPFEAERILRVYLPSDYDGKKKHKLLIMSDGQNIVDKYTSAYGEWDIDEHNEWLINHGYPSIVVVGIDCPKMRVARVLEYSIYNIPFKKNKLEGFKQGDLFTYGERFADDVVNKIIPMIREIFSVSSQLKDTAFGGSSMGGILAFNMLNKYPDVFSFGLCFSPAFFLHFKKDYLPIIRNNHTRNDNKIILYSGNVDYEHAFLKDTIEMYDYLLDIKHNPKKLKLLIDMKGLHNEKTWSKHFIEAILFWYREDE